MASDPGFVTGQVPSATQWNGYFSGKADIVYPFITKTGNYIIQSSDIEGGFLTVLASADSAGAGGITITFPLSLVTTAEAPYILLLNTGTLGYPVYISDGTNVVDYMNVAAGTHGQINAYRSLYPTPTILYCFGHG